MKMKVVFLAVCAATFSALASNVTQYRALVGPEGWTKPDVETGILQKSVFGDQALSTKTPFSAVMRVTMPAKEHVRYGSLVSFGKYGSEHQITLTVVDVVGATSGSNSDSKGYIAGKNDAGKDLGFPTGDAMLPKDLFRAYLTYDVALTYDGAIFKVYVDGKPVTLSDASGKAVTATLTSSETLDLSDVCFGQRTNHVGTMTGNHDLTGGVWRDAVVFDAELSALQVASIHEKGVWNFLYDTQLISEPAKEGDTYVLASPEDFQWFIAMAPADAKVRLGADITLTARNQVFKPTFTGTFDGDGHTITLLPGASAQAEGAENVGLIAGTLQGATVKNLTVRMEGGVLAQSGAAGSLAGAAADTTLANVVVACTGTLEGGAVGGVVGEASGLTLKGVRVDFSGMALGKTVGGMVGKSVGALAKTAGAGTLAIEGSLLTFAEGETVDALLTGETVGAAVGQLEEGASLGGLTVADTCLKGATAAVGAGTPASAPALRLAAGSTLLQEGEAPTLNAERETLRTPTPVTFTVADALSEPVASEGWEISDWNPETKTFTLTFVGANLAATGTLTYEASLVEPAEDATWQGSVTVSHPLSNQTEDGWWVLDSEPDYAWYLASCPSDAKVRLAADITLQAKNYGEPRTFPSLEFDGQGHTITFPEGATLGGEYCGVVAGNIAKGSIKDVKVVVGGTFKGRSGAYVGGVLGSTVWNASAPAVTVTNVHVHLLATALYTGDTFNAAGLVGACCSTPAEVKDCSVLAEAGATFAPSPLKYHVALTCAIAKGTGKCTQSNVLAVDLGVVMPSGSAYTKVDGATAYRGCNVPPNYGAASTIVAGAVALAYGKPVTLAPEGLTIGEVVAPEGWTVTRGGSNAYTFTKENTAKEDVCAFTYTLVFGTGETAHTMTIPVATTFFTPPTEDEEGWYNLATEAEYAWYLTSCPNKSKVRLTKDINLLPGKLYTAYNNYGRGATELIFDGQGHTVTFPKGATMYGRGGNDEYSGVIAGQLKEGAIQNVNVVVGGTLKGDGGAYVGGILGSTVNGGSGSVTLKNAHVRLLGTTSCTGDLWCSGGLVGRAFKDLRLVEQCSVVAEAGANLGSASMGTALTCGMHEGGSSKDVLAVDLGIVMPSGKSKYTTHSGETAYKSQNVTANYGEATTILAGEAVLDYAKPITLAPEAVAVGKVTLPEAWVAARTEGTNAFTFTSGSWLSKADGTPCDFSYTVTKGDCAVEVPVYATFADIPVKDKDGWYNLDTEEDYAWYLTKCPSGSKVRLTADIELLPKTYTAYNPVKQQTQLEFDGQGHTVTLPKGATMKGEYCGVVAGQIKKGSVKNVNVVIGGTLTGENGAYVGGVLGSSTYVTGGSVSLADTHVRLLGTTTYTGNTWCAGGLVGRAFKDPVSVERCSVVVEAGVNFGSISSTQDYAGTALTCGWRDAGASTEVVALDFGAVLASKNPKYTTHSGETVYKASTVTSSYAVGKGKLGGTVATGTLEGEGPWVLAPEDLTVKNIQVPEGWTASLEGNTLALTGPAGITGAVTYGLAQFPLAQVPLSVTFHAAYSFVLPEGTQPSEAQTAALEAAAQAAGLESGAEPVTVALAGKASLDALELFTGICTADLATRTLTVAYDFGVTAIDVSDDRASVTVTVALRTASGTPAFAEGTQLSLKATEGETLLGEPTFASGASSAQISFPLKADTCIFRVYASRVAE